MLLDTSRSTHDSRTISSLPGDSRRHKLSFTFSPRTARNVIPAANMTTNIIISCGSKFRHKHHQNKYYEKAMLTEILYLSLNVFKKYIYQNFQTIMLGYIFIIFYRIFINFTQ